MPLFTGERWYPPKVLMGVFCRLRNQPTFVDISLFPGARRREKELRVKLNPSAHQGRQNNLQRHIFPAYFACYSSDYTLVPEAIYRGSEERSEVRSEERSESPRLLNKGWKFLKKLWCCVGGGNKVIWLYQLSWKCKLATVTSCKDDVSSVSPSSERRQLLSGSPK